MSIEDNIKHSWETGLKLAITSKIVEIIFPNQKSIFIVGLEDVAKHFAISSSTVSTLVKKYANTGVPVSSGSMKGCKLNKFSCKVHRLPSGEGYIQMDGNGRHLIQGEDIVKSQLRN